jgi:beta-N-acetylhexosaminidase
MRRLLSVILITTFIGSVFIPTRVTNAGSINQSTPAQEKAALLLDKMSPEERVGQLFLVSFEGSTFDQESQIYKLITEHHIGGVVLRTDSQNFTGSNETLINGQKLILDLQSAEWMNSTETSATNNSVYVPLFVGISQEGDLAPFDQIISGMTALPSEMAIGATWKTANAETVGSVLGAELNEIGFNLLLGPSLDVLDVSRTETGEDMGIRTFGGDPYWVAEMGKAFIKGVHSGSNNKLLVISKHFPGRGGSDRQPEQEVATVRNSLEQLKQIELSPFFAVTGLAKTPEEVTDGLLLSHIRYQGFQGNIRATTKPVSFDPNALSTIMNLPEFTGWQAQGGLLVSDDLGSAAVQKFFDPTNLNFDARQVVRSALLAGNDLLYIGKIKSSDDVDSFTTIVRTIDFFTQKYNEDSAFKQRVDEAALRILASKYRLYPNLDLIDVLPKSSNLEKVGKSDQSIFEVARQSITLISPDASDLDSVLPNPPQLSDRIVFLSGKSSQLQCSTCIDQPIFIAENLRSAVDRLYGLQAGEQIQGSHLFAYSYDDLKLFLNNESSDQSLAGNLQDADWVVFSFLEAASSSNEVVLFQKLFEEHSDLVKNKKIIGFANNTPYFLDATDISKFTAFYAVYSKIPMFVDVTARILFREIPPIGKMPISMTSVGYDLSVITSPDPAQVIPLMVEIPDGSLASTETPTTGLNPPLIYKVGDSLPLQTGIIKDHNGNQVPDGTIVRFQIDSRSKSGTIEQIEAQTVGGIARTTYRIPSTGIIELKATSEPALVSQILRLDITDAGGIVTSIEPTIVATTNPGETVNPVVTPQPEETSSLIRTDGLPTFSDWMLSTVILFMLAAAFYWLGWRRLLKNWNPKIPLLIGITGYLVYFVFVLGIPPVTDLVKNGNSIIILIGVAIGGFIGLLVGLIWRAVTGRNVTGTK